jgi:hypothetical protein
MDVTQAKAAVETAQAAFDQAIEHSLGASLRYTALQTALAKAGIRPGDPIVAKIDAALAQASMKLWEARQARDAATEALQTAQRLAAAGPPLFEMQLALVQVHDAPLYERYQRERDAVEAAPDEPRRLRARYILGNTKQRILRFEVPAPPAEVASS